MKTILLPTDFSENSWNAIAYAINFLEDYKCTFYVLHVNRMKNIIDNESLYLDVHKSIEEAYTESSKRRLKRTLKRISKEFPNNDNHKFYTITDYNFFVESIRNYVRQKSVDLIVMGTKGASGLKEYIIGSNTGDIITKVKCTTLVVPEHAKFKPLKEMAFPTDYALNYDISVLQPMSDILEKTEAALRLLHINKNGEQLNTEQQSNKDLLDDFFDASERSFHFLTNKKVEDAVQCFVESRDVDIIAMIAKNLNYFQQILFHSRVEKISYHTKVPFLVLHE
ncbi:MAG: universal stress protein [Winogradskyella sp.]|uniref:universal stress protein n=1 Tax=Winogradskyella sp. TaxID=1883156 RepID=UPI000F3B509D|nr:universal stress protein [Winogradskyella sp.]RNC87747.1 MAG: universal stress protein [Winogradskyella sp.]